MNDRDYLKLHDEVLFKAKRLVDVEISKGTVSNSAFFNRSTDLAQSNSPLTLSFALGKGLNNLLNNQDTWSDSPKYYPNTTGRNKFSKRRVV